MELIKRMQAKGTIWVTRVEGKSNRYSFPLLRESEQSKKVKSEQSVPTRSEHTVPIAAGTEPSYIRKEDIPPPAEASALSLEQAEKRKLAFERADDWQNRRWQTDDKGRRFLISPSTGERKYEEEIA
jgi:hypothetical protein